MAGPSVRLARVAYAALLAASHCFAAPVLAADCPTHDPLGVLGDPRSARLFPEALRSRMARGHDVLTASRPVAADVSSVPEDRSWWDGFGLPILNGPVHASIVFEGALIAAGEFTMAAGQAVRSIARWNGSSWSLLGAGLDGPVYGLTVYDGHLIAGGAFTGAIARWDGASWSPLGESFHGCVHAFTTYDGNLVAGGCFTNGRGVNTVAEWDGSEWRRVGEEIYGTVLALAIYQNEIVAGGANLPVHPEPSAVVRFDGTAWRPLGTGVSADYSTSVDALTVFRGELIAGGWFNRAGDVAVPSIAAWSGTEWRALEGAPTGVYQALLVEGDELVAAGALHDTRRSVSIARWNGASWSTPAEPLHAVRTLTRYQGDLVIGGFFQEAWPEDQPSRPLPWLGRLEGSRWRSFESWSSGSRGLFVQGGAQALLEYEDRLVVAGTFQYVGSDGGWLPYRGLAKWNGADWSRIGELNGYVYALERWQGDLIAGGNFNMPQVYAAGVARWDGSQWSAMGQFNIPRALAVYRGNLYGSGWLWNPSGGVEGVARWDGSAWQIVGGAFPPVPYGTWVGALAVHEDRLIAAGRFDHAGSVAAKNIAAWDGVSWQPVGSGRPHEVQSLTVFDGDLFTGGVGSGAGSPSALARWDGSAWEEIDIRGCTVVSALHATERQLFVGGQFDRVNGIPARNVAVWNREAWSPLGSGVDSRPIAFGEYEGSLYLGGWFTEAGGRPSFGIARWDGLERSPGSPPISTLHASPNPFPRETEIAWRLPAPGRVVVEVFDVRGRRVDTVLDRHAAGGPGSVTWQPSSQVTPGLYFARISANGTESVARIAYTP